MTLMPSPSEIVPSDERAVILPATQKQLHYADLIARRIGTVVPQDLRQDRRRLSDWIAAHKGQAAGAFAQYPSSKQVAYAERIARIKRREVPRACFQDRALMSKWIDSHAS